MSPKSIIQSLKELYFFEEFKSKINSLDLEP